METAIEFNPWEFIKENSQCILRTRVVEQAKKRAWDPSYYTDVLVYFVDGLAYGHATSKLNYICSSACDQETFHCAKRCERFFVCKVEEFRNALDRFGKSSPVGIDNAIFPGTCSWEEFSEKVREVSKPRN
jgi:hypothetical protein